MVKVSGLAHLNGFGAALTYKKWIKIGKMSKHSEKKTNERKEVLKAITVLGKTKKMMNELSFP
jgi:hypothetical protein